MHRLLIAVLVLAGAAVLGFSPLAPAQAPQPIGKFVAVEGEVLILPPGGAQPRQATIGTAIHEKDTIKAKKDSRAKLLMVDDSVITVAENTELGFSHYVVDFKSRTRESTLKLLTGKVRLLVSKLWGHVSRYEVETPTSVVGVRGTSMVIWTDTDPQTGKTRTWALVLDGELYVTAAGVTKLLGAGMILQVLEGEAPSDPRAATKDEMEAAVRGTVIRLVPDQVMEFPGITVTGAGGAEESQGPQGGVIPPGPPETPPPLPGHRTGQPPATLPPPPPPPR